jgi:polysaccharide biosynthesis transport protein
MPSLEEKFRLLRLRVQSEVDVPAFLVVGAAQRQDGTTFVACGLARAFAEAGYNTLLIDANPRNSGIAHELGFSIPAPVKPERIERNLSVASLFEDEERVVADASLSELVAGVRWRYSVSIVDVPALPGSGSAMQLAQAADGILIAVRLGRRPGAEDQEMKRLLEPSGLLGGKAFTGVVPTRASTRRRAREAEVRPALPPISELIGGLVMPRVKSTG